MTAYDRELLRLRERSDLTRYEVCLGDSKNYQTDDTRNCERNYTSDELLPLCEEQRELQKKKKSG